MFNSKPDEAREMSTLLRGIIVVYLKVCKVVSIPSVRVFIVKLLIDVYTYLWYI